MKIIRTYFDSNIIIKFHDSEYREEIRKILGDDKRIFYSSIFLEMETLPFLIKNKKVNEIEFLETYFRKSKKIPFSQIDIKKAFEIQKKYGVMGTVDSIHLSLCNKVLVDEFITLERDSRTIYYFNKANSTPVIHLRHTH